LSVPSGVESFLLGPFNPAAWGPLIAACLCTYLDEGKAGRDFHNFNMVYRDNPEVDVIAFTTAQISGTPGRRYPPSLAGSLYPEGMLTTDNYECTWGLFKSIPSIMSPGKTVFDETMEFNELYKTHSKARLIDKNLAKVNVESMGFSMQDRIELLKLTETDEAELGTSRITDWLSPSFFQTNFWYMWANLVQSREDKGYVD
jgi:MCRA family